jgi:TatA/E family protein of Tat protein translocase
MGGFSMVHWLIFGIVVVLLFGNNLPTIFRALGRSLCEFKWEMQALEDETNRISNEVARRQELELRIRNKFFRFYHRGTTMSDGLKQMKDRLKKFLWTWKFWALLGIVGCVSGLYFQRVAANGSGLWCLGLIFLGAAYLEQKE